jgi:sec-independent protein translocase protein TatB
MFEVGFSEMLVIAFVALVVLGPEKLPKAARFAGLWIRRARAQWYSVKAELEREIAAEQLKSEFKSGVAELKQELDNVGAAPRSSNDADSHAPQAPAEMVAKDDHFAP